MSVRLHTGGNMWPEDLDCSKREGRSRAQSTQSSSLQARAGLNLGLQSLEKGGQRQVSLFLKPFLTVLKGKE